MSNRARIELDIDLDSQNGQAFMAKLATALSGSGLYLDAEIKQPKNETTFNSGTTTDGPKKPRNPRKTTEPTPEPTDSAEDQEKAADIDVKDPIDETASVTEESAAITVTLDDLRVKTTEKAKNHRDAIKAKLTNDFKANNVASLSPEHYVAYDKFLDSLS